jgi:methylenetetrahydrofolate dehydrogenase (NADP+)/methenyltetrahydrofolate cyclohydrolase
MAVLLDGKALAAKIRKEIASEVSELKSRGITPALAVIIVGDDPASRKYVDNKKKDCAECGIKSIEIALPADVPEDVLLGKIGELNSDRGVHGILVQLPLPKAFDERRIIDAIDPAKDVDAFHPSNVGRIMIGNYGFVPCTPAGVMALLDEYSISPEGKNCVVIGRSNIVGKPMAMLLLQRNGTVTICHSKTKNLPEITKRADILVCAVGKAGFLTADMVKPGAVVVDVGMNAVDGRLTGDADFENVSRLAGFITPAPGGIGPMTRVMLLKNTLKAAKNSL